MGKNNQQRRAAKRRNRAANLAAARGRGNPERPAGPPVHENRPPVDQPQRIAGLIADGALVAFGDNADQPKLDEIVQALIVAQSAEQPLMPARMATDELFQLVATVWENGWQPADLVHIVRRHQGAREGALIVAIIAAQARKDRTADRAPQEWLAQLSELGIAAEPTGPGAEDRDEWLIAGWQFAKGISPWDGWRDILQLLGQLQALHRLAPLGPPPSQWDRSRASPPAGGKRTPPPKADGERSQPPEHDPRMLGKIRALLSKAEATTFAEEAEAFTAKAQDLMTRYAIDEALLEDSAGDGEVIARRIHIDNPYAQAKVQLLSTVGQVNRVRVVWDDHHGMATVVGMVVDLQLVEMLFTSLLVQATRALTDAGNAPRTEPGYRSGRLNRSPSFRRAFLLAYAHRIGERLAAAGDLATAEANVSRGTELVPVLARRTEAVDKTFERLFPDTREIKATRVDARGWHAGRAAADRAVFAAGKVESA